MTCAGIDLGYQTSSFAVPKDGGIEVLLNDYSKRQTPSLVSFGEKQRFLGEGGKMKQTTQYKNTISYFKPLIGRKFSAPDVQEMLAMSHYKFLELDDGTVGVEVNHAGEQRVFSVTQIMAMLISHLKTCLENDLGNKISESVVGIPSYFNDAQRHAMLNACTIANINCLRVMNETAAVALAYGIYKTDLEDTPRRVVFIDFGHSCLQLSLCSLVKGRLKMEMTKSVMVGGRDFDLAILKEMARQFQEKTKLDLLSKPRVAIRMETECEKLKKMMSANSTDIPLNIECLMDDHDFRSKMNREEFEVLCAPLFDKIKATVSEFIAAIVAREIPVESLHSVEIVGGASRISLFKQIVTDAFGKTPNTTLNADEAVARGCALMSAMLSPTFMVREFKVEDNAQYGINLSWLPEAKGDVAEDAAADSAEPAVSEPSESPIYAPNSNASVTKILSFHRKADFVFSAKYVDPAVVPDEMASLGDYTVEGCAPSFDGKAQKVKVEVSLDGHGCFNVTKATLIEKVPVEEEPEEQKPAADAEGDAQKEAMDTGADAGGADSASGTQKQAGGEEDAEGKDQKREAAADESSAEKPAAEDQPKKKKAKITKRRLKVSSTRSWVLSERQVADLVEVEATLALGDRREKEKNDARNALEEYIYDMRDKLTSIYEEFIKPTENDTFRQRLTKMEDWLYDEGEDQSKQVYVEQLEGLRTTGDAVVSRASEWETRPAAIEKLNQAIVHYRKFLNEKADGAEKYEHISEEDVEKVDNHIIKKEKWIASKLAEQQPLTKADPPVVTTTEVEAAERELRALCDPIVNKPKPKVEPPKEEPPKAEEEKAGEAAAPEGETEATPDAAPDAAPEGEATEGAADPEMDTAGDNN